MKQVDMLKFLFFISILCTFSYAKAQVHPLGFGPHPWGTSTSGPNWYADYVGARIIVTAPASVAGSTPAGVGQIGTGTQQWPDMMWPVAGIINVPVVMDSTSDSFGASSPLAGDFTGKIALLWRGPIASPVDFGEKALNAQNSGAIAVVFINEYPGGTPFSPGYTAHGTAIHIPVLMIGNIEGITLSGIYHSSPANTVRMTLTPWGLGNANDIGLVPNGEALFNYYAIPASQLGCAGNSSVNYMGLDGAFIANFGMNAANGVKLKTTLSFTAVDGVAVVEHTDSTLLDTAFAGLSAPSTRTDSIMGMFPDLSAAEYSLTATVPGTYTLTYTASSDSVDQYPADNSLSTSFYLTDSLFSRGRYDFVNNVPLSSEYEGYSSAAEITWGNFYYVAQAGSYIGKVQYSISNSSSTHPSNLTGSNDIYVFTWVDGSNGQPLDSLVQDGELDIVSWTTHLFVPGVDTSTATITQTTFSDASKDNIINVPLTANTWYYVAIDIPSSESSADTNYLGIDGVNNPYPRIFGRWWDHGQAYLDYSNFNDQANGQTFRQRAQHKQNRLCPLQRFLS